MRPSVAKRFLLALGAALALRATPARAVSLTPPQPLLLFGDESAATTDGATGALLNPALTGVCYPSEFALATAQIHPRGEVNQVVASVGGVGFIGRRVKDESQSLSLALANGAEPLRFGFTTSWLVDQSTHEFRTDHALGLLSRPTPWLSLGGVVDHLLQPEFRDNRLARTYTIAAGFRPLAMSPERASGWGTRLTLTSDLLIVEDGEWSQSRVRWGASFEPIPGLVVRGSLSDHGVAHIGIGFSGSHASVNAQTATHDGLRRYEAYDMVIHGGAEPLAISGPADRRVAAIRVAGDLGDDRLAGLSLFGGGATTPVKPIRDQLQRALDDPTTRGVLLTVDGIGNMAQIEELRPRIEALRRAGKPVVAYLESGATRPDLYLASACDRIVAPVEGVFMGLGLRSERRYYRRMLDDLGIRLDRASIGAYKSAFRNFSVDSTPPEDRAVIEHALDQSQELFVSTVAEDRRMDRARLLTVLDGRSWSADEVRKAGLIDSVGFREDALAALGGLCGLGRHPQVAHLARDPLIQREWMVPAPIAIVYASGGLETGASGNDLLLGPTLGSQTAVRQIESAFRRRGVRAVVLRVESPGGESLASSLIDHTLVRMKRETGKPLVVSMGSVAASGGYEISAHGDRLFADRFTRTGSIGVLAVKPSFEGFYRKHGVREDDFQRGAYMGGLSYARDWDARMQAAADSSVADSYRRFLGTVADGRHMTVDDVEPIARGRVWMGEDARERKLVDAIGGLDAALDDARRRAGIPAGEKIRLIEYRRPRPALLERLIGNAVSETFENSLRLPERGGILHWADDEP